MQKLLSESEEAHNPRYVKYIQFYCKIKIELVQQQWSTFWNLQFWTMLNWNYFWLPFKVFIISIKLFQFSNALILKTSNICF